MRRAIQLVVASAVIVALITGCDLSRSATPDPSSSPASPSPAREAHPGGDLPAGFKWAGGKDTGIHFGVPADWVERPPESDDLRDRGGTTVVDPLGAAISALYEAHLIASCGGMRGITSIAELAAAMTANRSQYRNPVTDVVSINGANVVRSEYDSETESGELEHWYAYNVLPDAGWMCSITLVTPLDQADRQPIEAIFDQIGTTIDAVAR